MNMIWVFTFCFCTKLVATNIIAYQMIILILLKIFYVEKESQEISDNFILKIYSSKVNWIYNIDNRQYTFIRG